jgi:hypothetical protein
MERVNQPDFLASMDAELEQRPPDAPTLRHSKGRTEFIQKINRPQHLRNRRFLQLLDKMLDVSIEKSDLHISIPLPKKTTAVKVVASVDKSKKPSVLLDHLVHRHGRTQAAQSVEQIPPRHIPELPYRHMTSSPWEAVDCLYRAITSRYFCQPFSTSHLLQ